MTARLRILNLLRSSPPLLASQIAWKLGLKLEVVSSHLGLLRRDGLTAKWKVYDRTATYRVGHQIFRMSQVFWTTDERWPELRRLRYDYWQQSARQRQRELRHTRRRPITGDMIQMLEDIRYASSQ